MNRAALLDWLAVGSKEDWAERVGALSLPTLLLAGTEEAALGPEAQRQHTLPHFPNGVLIPLVGAGHLAPIERPVEVADRIAGFLQGLGLLTEPDDLDSRFLSLIDSPLTSSQTRAVLTRRLEVEPHKAISVLTDEELLILRSVADRIVPDARLTLLSESMPGSLCHDTRDGETTTCLPILRLGAWAYFPWMRHLCVYTNCHLLLSIVPVKMVY